MNVEFIITMAVALIALAVSIDSLRMSKKANDQIAYSQGRIDASRKQDNSDIYEKDIRRLKKYQEGLNWRKEQASVKKAIIKG